MTNSGVWPCMWMCVLGVWVMIHGCTVTATYQPAERQWHRKSSSVIFTLLHTHKYTHTHSTHKPKSFFQHPLWAAPACCVHSLYLVGLQSRWWRTWPRLVLRRWVLLPVACMWWWRWGRSAGTAGWSWRVNVLHDSTLHQELPTTSRSLQGGEHTLG